ncbi:glycosyl hydrolase [Parapedobacter indicus]|uniref:Alpha-L-rhamnosidase n=1 Tax=Parapedobacter indicus TaxID=1477437 RepID=A0A1I3CT31_9SPHI|nr:glycosyl hydrolase [Parapedobacter indicus]PPL04387.1 alpha-L-rhamnosidase-like protein [Parapedobacter indicus]SFH77660.1 alpha-L-rhamnosidase [Parapedobacter indicus]
MNIGPIYLVIFCISVLDVSAQQNPWPEPTKESKPWARWWWMGNAVDTENLTAAMSKYSEVGIGGLEIAPIYGARGFEDRYLQFLSPAWVDRFQFALREGDRLDLGIDLTTGTGWPFGGPQVSVENAATRLIYRTYRLGQGQRLREAIRPESQKKDDKAVLLEVVAFEGVNHSEVITEKVRANGMLDWAAPNGDWTLYAIFNGKTGQKVKRAAPGGAGYTLDHFSSDAVDHYLARFDKALVNEEMGVRAFYNDSYEVYGADWTPGFFGEFKSRRGYDLRLYLPKLLADSGDTQVARIKSDYRETIGDLLRENFTTRWTAWAHDRGAKTKNQAHGSPANLLDLYATVDIPEMETFGSSDFPIPGFKSGIKPKSGDKPDPVLMKFPSSAAHLMGKPLVSSETFTWLGEHFRSSLAQFKPEVEQCFLAGINHVFYHGITYSPQDIPWPGWLFYASVNMVPTNSWWSHSRGLNTYITRVQSILQSSSVDNEVLLYWPIYDVWDDPKGRMKALTYHNVEDWLHPSAFYRSAIALMDNGYGVDFVSDRLLADMQAVNGKLQSPGGNRYRVLLIPAARRIPLETLAKIKELAEMGATVVFEELPEDVPGFGDYERRSRSFKQAVNSLPSIRNVHVIPDVISGLENIGLSGEPIVQEGIRFIRLKSGDKTSYYLVNHGNKDMDKEVVFNAKGNYALLMDPQQGDFGWCHAERQGDRVKVRLQIRAGESLFVQFADKEDSRSGQIRWNYWGSVDEVINPEGGWKLTFIKGGPQLPANQKFREPVFWTSLSGEAYSSFSGTAAYETTCIIDAVDSTGRYDLVLDDLAESAQVWVNGEDAGFIWSVPYHLEISKYLRPGKNTLRIEVANLMANRIRFMDRNRIKWNDYHEINVVNIDYKKFDASAWEVQPSGLQGSIAIWKYR